MRKTKWVIVTLLFPAALLADEVILRGGGRISGEIVERTETTVTVDIGAGRMSVGMADVVRIEAGQSPLGEYRERARQIAPGDAEAWRELGRWARNQGLGSQAREAYSQVLVTVPGDPEANQALGLVLVHGQWVTEEESYVARGFVQFEGEWMMPEERSRILADRSAQEQTDRQALAEQNRADEEAARAREAEERAAADQWWNQGLPQYGDPVYWGWGVGPAVWPAQPVRNNPLDRPATLPARGQR